MEVLDPVWRQRPYASNSTIPFPNEVSFVQPADPKISQGSSLLALVELGKEKGYELVCVEGVNAFFVKSQYFPLFEIADNSVAVLRRDLSAVTHLFHRLRRNRFPARSEAYCPGTASCR